MFAVHDKIAGAIAAKLKTTLAGTPASRAQRATDNIEAYEASLKGRALLYVFYRAYFCGEWEVGIASRRAAGSVRARVSGGASGGGAGGGARRETTVASCNTTRTEHRNGRRPERQRGMMTTPAGARMQRVHSGAPCARTTQP